MWIQMASKKKCFWTVYNLIILNTMLICLYYKQKSVFLQAKTREMETNNIKVTMLEPNKGQIDGVPRNPRWWSSEDVDTLGRSVEETPELMQARPLIVTKAGKKYVVLGGNMRLEAVKRLKWKECPCCVFEDITVEKMEEIVLKDNSSFGDWDTDELANKWDDLPLSQWGVNVTGTDAADVSADRKSVV